MGEREKKSSYREFENAVLKQASLLKFSEQQLAFFSDVWNYGTLDRYPLPPAHLLREKMTKKLFLNHIVPF